MALKRVIPCLDVDAGRVVKGTNFVGLRDAGDPVELAARYDAEGADELVFLDITASHEQRETIVELARRTADNVFIPFTIGGGIRSVEDAQAVLDAGADKVSVNSSALARPELISELAEVFGSQCVVVAIDAEARRGDGWDVYVNGGRTPVEGREAVAWAREAAERGAGEVLLTSMDRDGTTDGYDLELTRAVADAVARAGDRLGRRRRARAPGRGRAPRAAPTRCSAPRSSTTASTRSPRRSGHARGRDRGPLVQGASRGLDATGDRRRPAESRRRSAWPPGFEGDRGNGGVHAGGRQGLNRLRRRAVGERPLLNALMRPVEPLPDDLGATGAIDRDVGVGGALAGHRQGGRRAGAAERGQGDGLDPQAAAVLARPDRDAVAGPDRDLGRSLLEPACARSRRRRDRSRLARASSKRVRRSVAVAVIAPRASRRRPARSIRGAKVVADASAPPKPSSASGSPQPYAATAAPAARPSAVPAPSRLALAVAAPGFPVRGLLALALRPVRGLLALALGLAAMRLAAPLAADSCSKARTSELPVRYILCAVGDHRVVLAELGLEHLLAGLDVEAEGADVRAEHGDVDDLAEHVAAPRMTPPVSFCQRTAPVFASSA